MKCKSNSALTTGLVTLAAAASLGGTAQAHHSWAMFDLTQCKTVEGTVRTFQWNFPHSWLWVNVPDGKGGIVTWAFEGEPPSNLSEHGWTKTSLKKGDKVKVKFSPLRDGRNGGGYSLVTFASGKVLEAPRGRKDICAK